MAPSVRLRIPKRVHLGINRLDYSFKEDGRISPSHIESCNSTRVAHWLERVLLAFISPASANKKP